MTNPLVISDTTKLSASIKAQASAGAKLDKMIHVNGLSVMWHLSQHRDKTMFSRLVAAMPKSSRAKALVDWFNTNAKGAAMFNYDGSCELKDIDSDEWVAFKSDIDFVIESADAKPFWEKKERGDKDKLTMKTIIEFLNRKANARDASDTLKADITRVADFARSLQDQAQLHLDLNIPPVSKGEPARASLH
jgi:hypothetical protein